MNYGGRWTGDRNARVQWEELYRRWEKSRWIPKVVGARKIGKMFQHCIDDILQQEGEFIISQPLPGVQLIGAQHEKQQAKKYRRSVAREGEGTKPLSPFFTCCFLCCVPTIWMPARGLHLYFQLKSYSPVNSFLLRHWLQVYVVISLEIQILENVIGQLSVSIHLLLDSKIYVTSKSIWSFTLLTEVSFRS